MKPKMSDDGKKNGGQVKSAVVGERKVIVVRKRSFRSSSGRQFGVMIRHGLSNRNRYGSGVCRQRSDTEDSKEPHNAVLLHLPHSPLLHLPGRQGHHKLFQLILACFLKITCRKYDVPRILSIAFSQLDGLAV